MLVFEWVFFVVLLRFQLLCSPTGVPGAACCVRPGCSIRPPSTAHDLPSSVWSLCVPVGGGPPARSPHASLTARSGRSRGPPWPCRHPPAPRPGPPVPPTPSTPVGPGVLACGLARRLEARPGPSATHGHRDQAPTLPTGVAARPYWDPVPHPQTLTSLIPEPTRNFACNSPDTTSNLQFRSLELQRFQTLLELLSIELHATFRGQTPNTTTGTAAWPSPATRPHKREKNSPCSPPSASTREKVRPAPPQLPKISLFSLAGRTFSRFGPKSTPAGRVFSR